MLLSEFYRYGFLVAYLMLELLLTRYSRHSGRRYSSIVIQAVRSCYRWVSLTY